MIREEEEEDFGTLEESSILCRVSGPNEELNREDQPNEEPASSDDSIVHSPRKEQRRRYTRKEKGEMKMSEYDTNKGASNSGESDTN